jgi:hypothetical protein
MTSTGNTHGGKRAGAGRPAGSLNKVTEERRKTEEALQMRIMKNVERLINAQLTVAEGCSFLYRIDKDEKGKSQPAVLVTDRHEIEQYLDGETEGESYYYITTQKPESYAINSMLDRAYGKAVQKTELTGKDGKDLPQPIINVVSTDDSD